MREQCSKIIYFCFTVNSTLGNRLPIDDFHTPFSQSTLISQCIKPSLAWLAIVMPGEKLCQVLKEKYTQDSQWLQFNSVYSAFKGFVTATPARNLMGAVHTVTVELTQPKILG